MSEASKFTVTLAQLNPTVGDVAGNAAKARATRKQAAAEGADLVVFPELFIAGYPPEDLVLKPAFQAACRSAIEELARETADGGPAMLIGSPWGGGGTLYNACALLAGGGERARETADGGPAILIGSPWVDGGKLYNACALLDGGRIAAHTHCRVFRHRP